MVLFFSFAAATSAATAAPAPLSIWIDGEPVKFGEQKPFVEKGTTYVPVRMLLEKLDFELDWNEKLRIVTATSDKVIISLEIDRFTAYVNTTPHELTAAPKIVNKSTYVPLRFIVEAAGYEIEWDEELRAVIIDTVQESRGFMYKVEKDGNVVYMLGSIHVANEAMYPLREEITEAYEQSDFLTVEVNVESDTVDVTKLLEDLGTYKDGTTLRNHLSSEGYQAVVQLLTDLEIETNALDRFEPWFASMILNSWLSEDSEYEPELGIDQYFLEQAIEEEKPILELESFESQYKMYDGFSKELQESMLMGAIYGFYYESEGVEDLSAMWVEGDVEELNQMAEDMQSDEEYYNALLKNRNLLMAEQIDGYLSGKQAATFFVVVGALHLAGEDGLVALLEEMGYTVTRV
ncbi:TraB/GumN family protein [Paenibacillus sp. LHD-117]|uniref:TraB/GumN family protein n=1 Tax=Paenibacillus sp. LHD-117 TaxID=3071412 RepID=UPI0027E1CFEC|nr:TraB/GumN family protein [Paenibacillus sp. LHD-117]MDQ6422551.1 TraB/GumN family protein [Paenibacillus sp. LHD-117]